MANLANQTISSTYDGLIKTASDDQVPASGVQILEDGVGNTLSLALGRANNGVTVTGTVTATAFVGDGSGLTGISVSPTLDEVTDNGATTTNNITVGDVTSTAFIKSGGTSSQFLKADGSIDSNTYLTTNAVSSVNSQTGTVVLDADDISDASTTNKFTTQTEIDKLAGIEAGADVTDATNVAAAGALMSGTAALSDLVDVSSATPTDGQVLTYDTVNGWQPEDSQGGGGSDYTIQEISTNTTAVKDNLYVFTASLTLTLPASPSVGDKVGIANMSGTNTPVVARNGNLLIGVAEDLTIDVQNIAVEFIYSGATEGWIMFADAIYGAASTGGGGGTVDGSGTTNYVSKWSDSNTLTDSVIYESGGNIGVGTTSPILTSANRGNITINGSAGAILGLSYGDSAAAYFYADNTIGKFGTYTSTPLVFTTNDTERMRILPTGGLTFNGDTAAANALDDYEEGTFTPAAVGLTTAGTTTYAFRYGYYTKIGRQVNVTIAIEYSALTGTGALVIQGIPFVIANLTRNNPIGSVFTDSLNWTAGSAVVAFGTLNSQNILLYGIADNAGGEAQLCVNESAGIRITMTYFTA